MTIPLFKDFYPKHNINIMTGFINATIDESCHLVDEIEYVSMDICSLIRKGYASKKKNSPVIFLDENKIGKYNCETFIFKNNPHILLFGCDCEIDLKIINVIDDLSLSNIKNLCQKYSSIKIVRSKEPINKDDKTSSLNLSFLITGTIIFQKLYICPWMKSAISHEVRHAFIFYKKYNDKSYEQADVIDTNIDNWDKLYMFCRDYIEKYNNGDYDYVNNGENNYFIIYSLYSCDKEEIDAFTQSAYDELRWKKSNQVKKDIKYTDLWNITELFKEIIDKSDDGKFKSDYIRFRKDICKNMIPRYSETIKLIKRRYKDICQNISYIIMLIINENNQDIMDEKYMTSSYKGLYVDNRKYYI